MSLPMLSFGFKDALDILGLVLLLYYLYSLMKSTRAAGVFGDERGLALQSNRHR